MVNISKIGDSTIKFTFTDNDRYLYNGEITLPLNSLILEFDSSDLVIFKKIDGDVFVTFLLGNSNFNSKESLIDFYKTSMVGSTGGGGGGGVDSGTVQTMIDESISGKADSSAVTEEISAATADYFDGAEYDSGTTRINFYHGNTVKAYIDASAFIVDGMIDNVSIETIGGVSYLVIDFNTASGKEDIQIPLTDIFDPSNYYTKDEVDAAISAATDDMATQTWVGEQGYITGVDLSNYATLDNVSEATSGKVDTSTYTAYTAATDTEIGNKLAISDFNSYSGTVDTAINSKASESDLSALTDVVTAHTANTDIHVTTAQTAAWNAKSDFSGSYNDLTDKPTIPTVPTSNTAFTNDAGYITSDAISGKVDTTTYTAYTAATDTVLSGKQDTLSAGTNITIIDNVISAEGGGGKAVSGGTNISITTGATADTINCTLPITADTKNNYIFISNSTTLTSNKSGNVTFGTNNHLDCNSSFVVGGSNYVYGNGCFVYGFSNEPRKLRNGLFGDKLKSTNSYEFCFGQYNNSVSASTTWGDSGNTLFSVGNGTADNARHNAFEIRQNGDIYLTKDGQDVKLQDQLGGGGGNPTVELTQAEYDALVTAGTVSADTYYIITDATAVDMTNYYTTAQTDTKISQAVSGKQDTLVSGTNIKTINNESILGSGNIDIQGGGVNVVQTTGTSTTDVMSQDAVTTALNNKANKSAAFGGYSFGTINNADYIQYRNVNYSNIGNSIYYPKINGKGILTNSQTFAQDNYNFQLVETSAITTSVTSASTDSQVPSAKAVHDAIQEGGGSITVDTALDSGSTNPVENRVIYDKFDEVESVTAAGLNALNDKFGGLKLVKLTQSEYNALSPNYDSNTLYVVVN